MRLGFIYITFHSDIHVMPLTRGGRQKGGQEKAETMTKNLRKQIPKAADAIRARLVEVGILLEDTPDGTTWRLG